jgi:hypothetical protein
MFPILCVVIRLKKGECSVAVQGRQRVDELLLILLLFVILFALKPIKGVL